MTAADLRDAEAELREKKNELAVAYGGGRSAEEREWFSALDCAKAQRDAAERALAELRVTLWEAYEQAGRAVQKPSPPLDKAQL